ncbi:Transposase, Mutator family [Posidoniimonas corsicana]|uniref:Mutator family transposase n=1 Tax=Posidoniimonas corsicana TaxID=1938618 RepID=A0A5C5V9B7_9BACT|nr:IS256 family transposase [Posidoniimonas corsicana]TWT35206.1 Transposase, Mutator family [Posidoniimonas corsicana]
MTHQPHPSTTRGVVELLAEHGFEGMAQAMELLLDECMKIERQEFLGVGPYQRGENRNGRANGFKPKRVRTRVGELNLAVPQVRDARFYPSALEKGVRSERALNLAMAEMYVQGVSTGKVTKIVEELCGCEVSSSEVSRVAAALDEELETWRNRPLGEIKYLIVDARYEKIREGGCVIDCAVLVAVGVDPTGHRSVLGVSVSLSEAEVHWREFFKSLLARGMHGVELITSDAHAGMAEARKACLPGVPWQRCQFHLQKNALDHAPTETLKQEVTEDLRGVFNAADAERAEQELRRVVAKHEQDAPKLAAWIDTNAREGLTVFRLPATHRKRLRTTNLLERLNRELKRRTRVATLFPNEASLLRLVTAVLMEQSEQWETGKRYVTF